MLNYYDSDSEEYEQIIHTNEKKPWIEKYRPELLDNIIGHEHIISSLQNNIKKKYLPHLLFYGPPGTGKTSTILACAKELYGNNINYMTLQLNASAERGIDVVRKRIKNFIMAKSLCFKDQNIFKLVILDEIDAMTPDAQSILKKLVETHTINARFCLICNYIEKIDFALRSRCTIFRFTVLQKQVLNDKIIDIINKEKITITTKAINTIIDKSNGDMRRIMNQLQSLSMVYKKITDNDVNDFYGYTTSEFINSVVEYLFNSDFKTCYFKILELKKEYSISIGEISIEIFKLFYDKLLKNKCKNAIINNVDDLIIQKIIIEMSIIEQNQNIATNDNIQLASLISAIKKNS
ncbi:replication factor C small subunit [Hokovirus HKV1]|uniref:Replication factor C small subunit n=1 Tax=Hokovirus HKV1 TaxID=1977638 RepID=A0A1V0SH82_9VIRU|nr:replication factor C small subunit [Hokovirus HKV1]